MKHITHISLLALSMGAVIEAQQLDFFNSFIVSPRHNANAVASRPIFAGFLRDVNGKGIRHAKVGVMVDGRLIGTVKTNKDGAWAYQPRADQALSDGCHMAQAYFSKNATVSFGTLAVQFTVDEDAHHKAIRSGNVDVANSNIDFPYTGCYTSDNQLTVIGTLADSSNHGVSGETARVSMNDTYEGSGTSDQYGMYSYQLTSGQALTPDGQYTCATHCVQSDVDLTEQTFTVDTTTPAPPVITFPTSGGTADASTFMVTGTGLPGGCQIQVSVDDDPFGSPAYTDDSGNWTCDFSGLYGDGSHTVSANQSNLANTQSAQTSDISFTITG